MLVVLALTFLLLSVSQNRSSAFRHLMGNKRCDHDIIRLVACTKTISLLRKKTFRWTKSFQENIARGRGGISSYLLKLSRKTEKKERSTAGVHQMRLLRRHSLIIVAVVVGQSG